MAALARNSVGITAPYYRDVSADRVVITGMGVVSPYGVGRDRFWDHIVAGLRRGEITAGTPLWISSASHCHGLAAKVELKTA